MPKESSSSRSDRHHRSSRSSRKRSYSSDEESERRRRRRKEDKLLREAQEYVKEQERRDRHNDEDDDDRKRRKREKSSSRKSKRRDEDKRASSSRKQHRHHRDDDSEDSRKRSSRKRYDDDHKKRKESKRDKEVSMLSSLGDPLGHPPDKLLDPNKDYFAHHENFWVWLYRTEDQVFNELTSEESRKAFGRYVKQYNQGKLPSAYYTGSSLPLQAIQESKTTSHTWSFKTTQVEEQGLLQIQQGVRKQTEYKTAEPRKPPPPPSSTLPKTCLTAEQRSERRQMNRQLKERVQVAQEELVGGRKDGFERQLEKKREKADQIHGAARQREEAATSIELDDSALYGSSTTSFQQALAREKVKTARRQAAKQERYQELQKKEQDKQKAMLEMLGLEHLKSSGQKIKIAPRKD